MRRFLVIAALLAAPLFALGLAPASASAATPVATIGGCYDCLGNFDTPVLFFNNTTGGVLTNSQIALHGYQGDNVGLTATVQLGALGAGQSNFAWGSLPGVNGSTSPFNLTAYDYDDEFIGTPEQIPTTNCGQPVVGCVAGGGPQWYAQTGNFDVTYTATVSGGLYDGDAVYAVFSPATNATGGFVGWEGLDPNGFSESPYDIHSGVVTGDLANIYLGLPPSGIPEPAAWLLMMVGVGGLGMALRAHRKNASWLGAPSV